MKQIKGTSNDESPDDARFDTQDALRLLRKGTDATLAIAPLGFPGRIVWTGRACVGEAYKRGLDAVNFTPASMPITVELKLRAADDLSIGEDAEEGGIALHWRTPFGKMELALYEGIPDRD